MEKKETSGRCSHAVEQAGPAGTEWLDSSGRRKKGEKKKCTPLSPSGPHARCSLVRSLSKKAVNDRDIGICKDERGAG